MTIEIVDFPTKKGWIFPLKMGGSFQFAMLNYQAFGRPLKSTSPLFQQVYPI